LFVLLQQGRKINEPFTYYFSTVRASNWIVTRFNNHEPQCRATMQSAREIITGGYFLMGLPAPKTGFELYLSISAKI
jgi:hypothetical protein